MLSCLEETFELALGVVTVYSTSGICVCMSNTPDTTRIKECSLIIFFFLSTLSVLHLHYAVTRLNVITLHKSLSTAAVE